MNICTHCKTTKVHPRCNPGRLRVGKTDSVITINYCFKCVYLLFLRYCTKCRHWHDTDIDGYDCKNLYCKNK